MIRSCLGGDDGVLSLTGFPASHSIPFALTSANPHLALTGTTNAAIVITFTLILDSAFLMDFIARSTKLAFTTRDRSLPVLLLGDRSARMLDTRIDMTKHACDDENMTVRGLLCLVPFSG